MTADLIQEYIKPGRRAHLVGIGGVSMCPLAEVLFGKGMIISGSDVQEGLAVRRLRDLGIPVTIGHQEETIQDAEMVIRTAAVHDDNPEVRAARRLGLPVFERAEVWGVIMRRYRNALCVAGTHGKTTTTSMCTHIAMAAQIDPTVMIGGTLPLLGTGHRVGAGETIILESCEYCNSFLSFFPTVAVILNIEADHLDFFKDLKDVQNSFYAFAKLVPEGGTVVANQEDPNTMEALQGKIENMMTFGLEQGDVHSTNLHWEKGMPSFDVVYKNETVSHVTLQVPGIHNVKNALAAAAAALALKLPISAIEEGLKAFRGAGRRFEYKGTIKGAKVFDDYAHHPSELKALLDMTSTLEYERVICAFQPHTYSRTKALFQDFAEVLRKPDVTYLAEIYAAREQNQVGISSEDLAKEIPGAKVISSLPLLAETLFSIARPGDLILTVGAGDIYQVGERLVRMGEN
ncbi:MAG: UDP-N-acetylmuramate--alanine ligase [Evtepia sp.]|nr:UDP-N-acetylmuramate--alanine ligase [Evtepia sp.]